MNIREELHCTELQLADYQSEGVLSCFGLLMLLREVVLVPEPLSGQERRQEDAQVGKGQCWQVQSGHGRRGGDCCACHAEHRGYGEVRSLHGGGGWRGDDAWQQEGGGGGWGDRWGGGEGGRLFNHSGNWALLREMRRKLEPWCLLLGSGQ